MSARLAMRVDVDADAVHGQHGPAASAPIDFIALARPQAPSARPLDDLEGDLETIRACLDTPFYRAMIEDLRDVVVARFGWLSRLTALR